MATETETLVETAGQIMQGQVDDANRTTELVIEQASAAIDHAQAQAAELARAAMETEIGRQVAALQQEIGSWQADHAEIQRQLSELGAQMASLTAQLAVTATLVVAETLAPQSSPESQSLSTQQLSTQEAAAITEILPESLSVEAASPAPETAPVKTVHRHRLL